MEELEYLRKRIAAHELLLKSLVTCLIDANIVDPEKLASIQEELDLLDGVRDGEIRLD